jgi:hypothetical protein
MVHPLSIRRWVTISTLPVPTAEEVAEWEEKIFDQGGGQ